MPAPKAEANNRQRLAKDSARAGVSSAGDTTSGAPPPSAWMLGTESAPLLARPDLLRVFPPFGRDGITCGQALVCLQRNSPDPRSDPTLANMKKM